MLHDWVVGNGSILPSAAVVLDSVASLGYREPKGLTVFICFRPNPFYVGNVLYERNGPR